jgi:twinkle protein
MHWTDIERKLCERVEEVCRHLFPNGHREGAEYVVGSLAGEEGESLKVNLVGKIGVWKDFAGDKGGNSLMGLWCHARNLPKFGYARREAMAFLGITDDFNSRVQKAHPAASSHPSERPDDSAWKGVAETWQKCQPIVDGGPVWKYLVDERKLEPAVLAAFDVREIITDSKWSMVFPYWPAPAEEGNAAVTLTAPVPDWMKFEALHRPKGKKREWTTKAPEKSLFGLKLSEHPAFKACGHVLICEGEKDALSWASYNCAAWGVLAVSVPFGAKWKGQDKGRPSPNREWLDRNWDWLDQFETVFVAMDSDDAGKKAAADIINEVGPRRCRLVTLPEGFKDPNECLMKGVTPEVMKACLDNAQDFAPDKIISAAGLEAEFLEWVFDRDEEEGIELPFEFPLRFRYGETTLWLGIEKSGKTTLLDFTTVAAMAQGERALVASFEVPWPNSHDKLCRQALGGLYFDKRKLKRPNITPEEREEIIRFSRQQTAETHQWLAPNLWYYRHVGIGNWRQLIDDIRWARYRLGIKWVQVDNFMRLGIAKDDYAQQAEAIIAFVSLAMELGIHLHMVLHQNKSAGAKGQTDTKRTASGAHELLGNPHNIVEVQRDDKKGKEVSELFEARKTGQTSEAEFKIAKAALDLKPDGKFLLHASRNGDTQDGSKYLWFLWESQQYVDAPPGHTRHAPIRFVAGVKRTPEGQPPGRVTASELPTLEEMNIKPPA